MTSKSKSAYSLFDADEKTLHLRKMSAVIEYRLNSSSVWQEVTGAWLIRQPASLLFAFAELLELPYPVPTWPLEKSDA